MSKQKEVELKLVKAEETTRELEKSFSDSDEEPLATKVTKQIAKPVLKKRGRKSNQELAEIAARQAAEKKKAESLDLKETSSSKLGNTSKTVVESSVEKPITTQKLQKDLPTSKKSLVENNTKILKNQTKTPVNSQKADGVPQTDDDEFVKGFDSGISKPVTSSKSAINLLPSKEESEKIFGIASVTLAQSCGPLDTKCTLGKCGSVHVHKPPLGPTVLTESALGASLSPKDRRKSKVNMTRDQIQKWLEEASWTPIPDDEGEAFDLKTASKASTPSIGLSKSGDDSQSSSLVREKMVDKLSPSTSGKEQASSSKLFKSESPTTTKFLAKVDDKIKSNFPLLNEDRPKQASNLNNVSIEHETNNSKKSAANAKPSSSNNSITEKKTPVYQQQQNRRTPVYKTDNKPKSKLVPMLPKSFGAFSPENEHSIYSFDKEDEDMRTPATPFRRSNSKAESEIFPKPCSTPNKQSTQPSHVSLTLSPDDNKKSISVEMSGSGGSKKVADKSDDKDKDAENESDSEGETFYIPLQASNVSGSKTIQGVAVKLGTEGAEGPNQRIIMHAKLVTKPRANTAPLPLPESMPNVQELVKTLMAGKKPAKSEKSAKPVPCATVQPRFKSNDIAGESSSQPEPSTSSAGANQRNNQAARLGKLNDMSLSI